MKTQLLIGTLAALVSISTLNAQPRPNRPGGLRPPPPHEEQAGATGQRPPRPHVPPVIATLDANHDGVISMDEIKNAPAALKDLDKNGDGQITVDEVLPPRPQRDDDDDTAGPPPPPLIVALDADHDGVISASEIANASAALLTLDANNDSQLTFDELCPHRPGAGDDDDAGNGPRPHGPPPELEN